MTATGRETGEWIERGVLWRRSGAQIQMVRTATGLDYANEAAKLLRIAVGMGVDLDMVTERFHEMMEAGVEAHLAAVIDMRRVGEAWEVSDGKDQPRQDR